MLQTFPRSARLTKTGEFSSVFSFKKSIKGKFLSLYYLFDKSAESNKSAKSATNFHEKFQNFSENSENSEISEISKNSENLISARLGIVVAKKMLKKAVDRNRCKRILRDIFRRHRFDLTNFAQVDIILRLNYKNITQLANYNELLRQDFLYLFNRLKNLKKSKLPPNKNKQK